MVIISILYYLLFLTAPLTTTELIHDLHLSKSEIRHNTKNNALEISVKIFIDDLELTLQEAGHPNLNILGSDEHPATDSILNSVSYTHLTLPTTPYV